MTVYMHKNNSNGKVYVGITKHDDKPNNRWQDGFGYLSNDIFFKDIVKYGWDNFEHEIIASNLTEDEASSMEKELITKYDCIDNGYNKSTGGLCPFAKTGKYNLHAKAVIQYTVDGKFIRKYNYIDEAAKDLEINRNHIIMSCRGLEEINGTVFRFEGQDFDDIEHIVIPEQYLNKPLKKEDKDALCTEIGLKNSYGRVLGWTSIKKIIMNDNYIVNDKKSHNEGRYTIIDKHTRKGNC